MPRRRILIGFLLLAGVLLAGYGLLWWYFAPVASAISRVNALKIKPGMTLAEVEEILGGPERFEGGLEVADARLENKSPVTMLVDAEGRKYAMYADQTTYGLGTYTESLLPTKTLRWCSRSAAVVVGLEREGRVYFLSITPVVRDWKVESGFGKLVQQCEHWFAAD